MNLTPLTSTAGKQEEIDLLKKVSTLFQTGTYTADLFSPSFLQWHETQLRNDCPPDVTDSLFYAQTQLSKAETATNAANRQLDQLKADALRKSQADIITRAQNDMILAEVNKLAEYRLRQERDTHAIYMGKVQENGILKSNVSMLENEIIKLKAQLFDLQNKG